MLFIPIQLLSAFFLSVNPLLLGNLLVAHASAVMCMPWLWYSTAFNVGPGLSNGVTARMEVSHFVLLILMPLIHFFSPGDCCFFQPSLGTLHLKKRLSDTFGLTAWSDYLSRLGHADEESEKPCPAPCPARVIFAASSISLPGMSLVMFCASKCQTPMNFFVVFTYHSMTFQ